MGRIYLVGGPGWARFAGARFRGGLIDIGRIFIEAIIRTKFEMRGKVFFNAGGKFSFIQVKKVITFPVDIL